MDLHVRYESDDNPKECTVKKLRHFDMAILHGSDRETPYGVMFNPHADKALSPADVGTGAFVAFDCSWESAGEAMFSLLGKHRALPYLVAANPMNFDHPIQLTTVEAIAAALVTFDGKERAEDVLSKFNWGHTFLGLNEEPLRQYAACVDSTEVIEIQRGYLERGR